MADFQGTVITKLGRELITKAIATKTGIHYTRAAISSAKHPSGADLELVTGLAQHEKDIDITGYSAGGGEATISTQVTNEGVTTGFYVYQVGLFADDPDLGEILYCIAEAEEHPDWLPAEGGAIGASRIYDLITIVSNVENVTATVNPSGFVTQNVMETYVINYAAPIDHTHVITDITDYEVAVRVHVPGRIRRFRRRVGTIGADRRRCVTVPTSGKGHG